MASSERPTRRKFIKGSLGIGIGAALFSGCEKQSATNKNMPKPTPKPIISAPSLTPKARAGVALVTSRGHDSPRIDLISLTDGRVLKTVHNFFATHAVVAVEPLQRFFVHGVHKGQQEGVVLGFQINSVTESVSLICEKKLEGGKPLHWQPNPSHTLIMYNTTSNKALHVLDTRTLKVETYSGGGLHSNMAFFNNNKWLVATDRLRDGTTLRVINRSSGDILSETPVGGWGHGVTVNNKTERAFVWAKDGVHIVDLNPERIGKHLGVIKPFSKRQRSWFCWSPQGERFSHDQTWNPDDSFSSWLTVLDTEKDELQKINVPGEALGTLGISPDGKIGMCGSHNSQQACLFDIQKNKFMGKVNVGKGNQGFFDRDVSFSTTRDVAFITNPRDQTMTAIDAKTLSVLRTYELPATPEWMKVIS